MLAKDDAGDVGDQVAAAAAAPKTPKPLSGGERFLAGLLIALGIVVVAVTLYAFSNTDSSFTFKSKEVSTTSEPVASTETEGETTGTATPEIKATQEVEYADTVVIFALTIGAALILAGGFYGRLRSLKLGGLEIGLVGEEEKGAVTDEAAKKVAEKVSDPSKEEAAKAAAGAVAVADLHRVAALGIKPTQPVIDWVSSQAAEKVAAAVR